MLAQVGSSSYTEGDLKRKKTPSECRRNGVRMGGNGKSTREERIERERGVARQLQGL